MDKRKGKRWLLKLSLRMSLKALGLAPRDGKANVLVLVEAQYDTKAELRGMYSTARAQVKGGQLTYAGAFDTWDRGGRPLAEAKAK